MEHQHIMQHRTPIQSHDNNMPRRRSSPHRPSSRGRIYREEAAASAAENHPGHVIQSRTVSSAHVLTKRQRSRSRGRRRRQQQQQQGQERPKTPQHESSFHDSETNASMGGSQMNHSTSLGNMSSGSGANNNMNMMIHDGKINEYGRCIRHPTIELASRDSVNSPWRVLLQDCPLCSLDDSVSIQRPEANHKLNDGTSSSQATATPSTKTNRTMTTEEESSVKSWTMSDASESAESEITGNNFGGRRSSTPEQPFNKQRPPPPPPPKSAPIYMDPEQDNSYISRSNHSYQQNYRQSPTNFDPVQSLKELGQKLVMESEHGSEASLSFDDQSMGMRSQASSARHRPPPPPPPPPPGRSPHSNREQYDDSQQRESISSLSTKELSQMRRQRKNNIRPPPRRGEATGADESNDSILGEASDIISRMESLTEGMPTPSSRRSRKQQQHNDLGGNDDVAVKATSERSSEEKRARARRRKEKAERKAARAHARELQKQMEQEREQEGGQTFTLPMNDVPPSRGRAEGGRTDDILQAAAEIRARALRSTSRSRERVKEASIFCGENPPDDHDYNDEGGDHVSLSSEKKRSILNPHGFEEPPKPPAVERRSQSRERRRRRSKSGGRGRNNEQEAAVEERRVNSSGRNRNREPTGLSYVPNQATTVEDLISRRREMRQKIAERQSNADQSRQEHRRIGSGGQQTADVSVGDYLSLNDDTLERWSRDQINTGSTRPSRRTAEGPSERRRGRSRSAVRDGISKIRSASLKPFKKKIGKGIDLAGGDEDVEQSISMDSGKHSISSFKRLLAKGKPRSLSRGRGSRSQCDQRIPNSNFGEHNGGWAVKSDPFVMENDRYGSFISTNETEFRDFDTRSASGKSVSSSSRALGIFKKSLSKKKNPKGGGVVRSLSRGSFRDVHGIDNNERWDARSEVKSETFTYNEFNDF